MTRVSDVRSDLKGQRSNVKVITSRRQFDACLPITRQRKVRWVIHAMMTFHTSSMVKGQGHQAALGGSSSHHLQGAGAYCGGPNINRTSCFSLKYVT